MSKTKSLFVVEIVNTNASSAYARRGTVEVTAHPSYETNTGLVTYSEAHNRLIAGLASRGHETYDDYQRHESQLLDELRPLAEREACVGPAVALFDKETAHQVGIACRWNNQQYRVKPARGRNRREGVEIPPGEGRWKSCQEE